MNFVEVNGAGLRYELSGGGDRTVVLIHEMGGTLESWDGVAPLLARHRRVLRYDMRGAGLSQKARGALSIDTMTDDLMALMDAAGIAKAALAGVAVGGAIALHTAVRFPARIAAVVATSPAVAIAADRRAAVLARVDRIEREGMGIAVEDSFASGYPTELRGDMARFAAFRARWLGNDPASYAAVYRMLAATDLTGELARIACPTLVIGGRFDRTRPPAVSEPIARAIPGAQYALLESGHYMAVQTPELVANAIAEFLDQSGA
jgi:3-oxoadipate enol-lactonase